MSELIYLGFVIFRKRLFGLALTAIGSIPASKINGSSVPLCESGSRRGDHAPRSESLDQPIEERLIFKLVNSKNLFHNLKIP